MGRAPCCDKANVKKGPWSPEEDAKLKDHIHQHGTGGNWITLPQKAGLRRCGKSCRLRWLNYLRPNIRHGEFSEDEDRIICALFATIGSRWSIIAGQLSGRTDNDIKNYWNTKLKKKLMATPLISSAFDHPPPITIPISIPENLLTNHMTFMNNYSQVKDHDQYFLAFGGETSSCSSDGSTSTANQIISSHDDLEYRLSHQFQDYQKPIHHHHHHHHLGDDQLMMDYSSLEEIKQLISTNSCNNNSMSLFVEEIKAEDRFMY